MKCLSVFLFSAAAALAADFNTGQAARALIGQPTFTRQQPGADRALLGAAGGVAYANNKLFVADSNRVGASPINNRVLIYDNINQEVPAPGAELIYTQRCPACVGEADVVLGQADFLKTDATPDLKNTLKPSRTGLRTPTAVASDGRYLVVADTDNNRVLIWNSIPTSNNQPADAVVGQPGFDTASIPLGNVPNNKSMRGPQGVWIQDGKLYVADTQNHRVLIYNSIPTSNGAAADVVLGQPDFNTFVEPDLTQQKVDAKATNMLNPVSVTSDGKRLYVTDLGHNRVLIWNSIPTQNQTAADIAIGQPDMTSAISNNTVRNDNGKLVKVLCDATKKDDQGNDIFPSRCNATLSFPRFALADGQRLFIADGGNDRVLVFKHIPTQSGESADYVIGQLGGLINQASDAADSLRTPMSLAWDGTNLYVSDTFNRRIMIYSVGEHNLPFSGVRNAASRQIFAVGSVSFAGAVKENDEVNLKIQDKEYKYKIAKDDTFNNLIQGLVERVNAGAGDANVLATPNFILGAIILTARAAGEDGNNVAYSASVTPTGTQIVATTGGATLAGGQDAAKIAPGTIVSILGGNLSERSEAAPPDAETLPTELASTQVYFDGVRAPLLFVSPDQINAQVPFEFLDTTSINAWVRTVRSDGTVVVTTPVAVTIVPQNPGIFAEGDVDPRPGVVLHGSSQATGTVSVDGTAKAGDIATVTIEDRQYTYTVKDGDTLASIRDALIALINEGDPSVEAFAAGVFTRIRLRARQPGPEGNGIAYTGKANDGAQVILTATTSALCCANEAYSRITDANPALPGETIIVYATGLGLPKIDNEDVKNAIKTGEIYRGPGNEPVEFVSSLAGGKTANVLFAGLKPGTIGVWEVHLELNSDLPTNPFTQVTIAQDVFVSNIVSFAVVNPNPPASETQP